MELGDSVLDAGMDPTEIPKRVEVYMRQHPDVDGILSLGPASVGPTIRAVGNMQIGDRVHFATFDLGDEIVGAIEDGVIEFAVDQQPYLQGYLPVTLLALYTRYGIIPANHINSGPGFVTKDNVATVKRLAGRIR